MKLISIVIFLILYISPSLSIAEVFKIKNIKIQNDEGFSPAVFKEYTANKPINVKYSYSINHLDETKYAIYFSFERNETGIEDIVKYGIMMEKIKNTPLENSIITSKSPTSTCNYEGTARILFKEVWLFIPEEAGEVWSGATISKVINASNPQRICQ